MRRNEILRVLLKNKLSIVGLSIIIALILIAILAPVLAPYPEQAMGEPNLKERLQPPSPEHPLGTDDMGRDILSRVIYGARTSLMIGFSVVAIALLIGVPLGLIAGYVGRKIDLVIMRITDVFLAFPPLLLALLIATTLGRGMFNAILALALSWWPWYTRLMRGMVVSVKERPYVEAAKAMDIAEWKIMLRHVLPNSISPVIIQATMDIGSAILEAAGLSFLGLGVQPPTPDWGLMVSEGKNYFLNYWWYPVFPGLAIFITVMAFNLLGDAVREAIDPRLRRRFL
ncbi:ABC-type dipeptide/oligopeptide/nickel transport systems, permease component [Archaeoglobus sulfaticallidus PM70-1]|uniref:ABC-type dipeptide/oligopeptide/nickel transport systems, permease component n=1 Tax=Archaeoglobus sulfaticallidus PM70-1 TaxID=387631 RepID=N0BDZ9_9EURY|nr:nickel transporter permease [Archaeoglobus sulfaticallidus]AGK61238.1 ABC-type dipeptide/oligopeptide/nickel transport systems, permease component [Archaeoglobus sulfaticallidus PM70-1]